MDRMIFDARNESDTAALGAALAEVLPDGTTVALCGTLGAGKTRLVQAMAEAAGVDRRQVVSPTFVLAQEYRGSRRFYHLDAFRLNDVEEFLDLGPEEFFESDAITLVEWADRVDACLPEERLEIHIEVTGAQSRRFIIAALGKSLVLVTDRLRDRLPASNR
jgi:tRNA threonylcarbamoyladenosine biosynthesis protein TsaE